MEDSNPRPDQHSVKQRQLPRVKGREVMLEMAHRHDPELPLLERPK